MDLNDDEIKYIKAIKNNDIEIINRYHQELFLNKLYNFHTNINIKKILEIIDSSFLKCFITKKCNNDNIEEQIISSYLNYYHAKYISKKYLLLIPKSKEYLKKIIYLSLYHYDVQKKIAKYYIKKAYPFIAISYISNTIEIKKYKKAKYLYKKYLENGGNSFTYIPILKKEYKYSLLKNKILYLYEKYQLSKDKKLFFIYIFLPKININI